MESQEAQRDAAERKRKQKFSQEELQVLISEVVRHYGKIFGKQTLHVAESIKRSTWLDIQGKVNAIGVTHRDLEDLKKRWYDIRIITKKKLAAHRKESAATGGGRNRAPRLTDIEEMVATTLEKECIHGIGDADSSARGAKKPGESKRSTAEVREKRREGAGPSTSHGGQDQEQAAPIPEEILTTPLMRAPAQLEEAHLLTVTQVQKSGALTSVEGEADKALQDFKYPNFRALDSGHTPCTLKDPTVLPYCQQPAFFRKRLGQRVRKKTR
ncbi:myb-related transcription factor, partner of profilin-like [Lissotriton helveticus]